jgi:hypothetical protein
MQTSANIWRTSANQAQQLRFPSGRLAVRSSDQRRAGPAVCTTPDPMAESMHNHGSNGRKYAQPRIQGQQYADVCKHSENVCKPSPAAAIPCGPFGIPSSDQRRPGQQYAQPWIHGQQYAQPWIPGPEVCTTPDPMAGSMKYADVCKHSENVCKQRPAVCKRLQTFGGRLQTKASSCDSLRAGWQL